MMENVGGREMIKKCFHLVPTHLGVWSEYDNDYTMENYFQTLLLCRLNWDLLDSTVLVSCYHTFFSVSTIPHKQHTKLRSLEHPQIAKFKVLWALHLNHDHTWKTWKHSALSRADIYILSLLWSLWSWPFLGCLPRADLSKYPCLKEVSP